MLKQTPLALAVAGLFSAPIYAEDSLSQETVVVTATRTNTQIFDTAASVKVIDDDAIEKEMVTGLDDLFRYTPGVSVKSNARQGVQSINIRGIEGNRIKVLVDGVAQGNQFDSGGTFVNSSRVEVDTDLLKAVEIVKGASSSLQGSDAIGGIVAFETKDPRDFLAGKDIGGHAKFNYSSKDNTFTESVALANRFGDLETLIAYTRHDGEQLENFGSALPLNSKANDLLTKLQYQLNDAHHLEFNGQYLLRNSAGEQEYENYSDASSDDETEQYQLALKHIWSADLALFDELEWQLAYFDKQENANTYRTVNPNVPFLNPSPIAIAQTKNYLYSDKGVQFDAQLEKSLTQGSLDHFFVYGVSFQDKDIKNVNDQYSDPGGAEQFFYMPSASESRYGLFVQDQLTFGNWIITPGIRYDAFETNPGDASANPSGNAQSDYVKFSDSALTGRLATVYKLNEQHRLFAQVSQAFAPLNLKSSITHLVTQAIDILIRLTQI
ncbi:TonB-dependent heme and hemoglobin receptor HutA [Vibrio ponticus]|nr:TonB-dependent heme and hemoglobin receptor HutA [Vibrio ponticus]